MLILIIAICCIFKYCNLLLLYIICIIIICNKYPRIEQEREKERDFTLLEFDTLRWLSCPCLPLYCTGTMELRPDHPTLSSQSATQQYNAAISLHLNHQQPFDKVSCTFRYRMKFYNKLLSNSVCL